MRYELEMIQQLCRELWLRSAAPSPNEVAVELEEGVTLLFINAEREEDSLIGLDGGGWHYHDDLICSDRHGASIEVGYLDVLTGLVDGSILICEEWADRQLRARSLVHRDFHDEVRWLRPNEEIRMRRIPSPKALT